MGPHARNKSALATRGKLEVLSVSTNQNTEICSFHLDDPCGGAAPIGIYYEVTSLPATPAGAFDVNSAVEVTIEWGYGQARFSRVFFVANGNALITLEGSSPNAGKCTVWGDWARVSARMVPAGLFNVPAAGVTARVGAQAGPATPENSDHLTAWFFGDTTDNGGANGIIALPPPGVFIGLGPLTLWRIFVQNTGNVGYWAMFFDQNTTAAPPPQAPSLQTGFIAPNGVASLDVAFSGKGFELGCVFVPSSTGDHYTALAGTHARLDYEALIL